MKERWQEIIRKVDALSLRERALVFLSLLSVVYLMWELIIFSPVDTPSQQANQQLRVVIQNIEEMRRDERTLLVAQSTDPDRLLRQELKQLKQQLNKLDLSLDELQAGLVPVDRLAEILQEILLQTGSLKLVSMNTLPVEELMIGTPVGADGPANNQAGVFKHSISVTVSGRYFQVVKYLQNLEKMPWHIYWDELHFEEDTYPIGTYRLKVYTLSTDEGLLGV